LLTLDQNLETEREALLAGLRRQNDAVGEERKRQVALARLRRERRQMETEEKYSAVALIFQASKQQEALLSSRLINILNNPLALAIQTRTLWKLALNKRSIEVRHILRPQMLLASCAVH